MDANTLLYLLIAILAASFVLDSILDLLNSRRMKPGVPAELKSSISEEDYDQTIAYQKERSRFSSLQSIFSFVMILSVLLTGFLGWWDGVLRTYVEDPLWLSIAYLGSLGLASTLISLPFGLYGTFVIEEKHGFNKTNLSTYLLDQLKSLLLTVLFGGGILWLFLWLVGELGPDFWIWFMGVFVVLSLSIQFFLIGPFIRLFNKLTPLEEGNLRNQITAFAQKVNFPLKKIMVIDGSKRSSKSNAFFTGFGRSRKVVLYDTLIEQSSDEELVAVLAHEIGHYKKKHIPVSMAISFLTTAGILFLLSRIIFTPELSFALGGTQAAIHLNLIAFALLFSPVSEIMGIAGNVLSRKNEFEADRFASDHYSAEPLASALIKLSNNNKGFLTPHPAYVFVNYSHPPMVERLRALKKN